MEIDETKEPQIPAEPQGLILLQDAQYALHQSGKWANFLAIMGFIGAGLLVLCGLFMGVVMSAVSTFAGPGGRFPAGFGAFFSIFYIGFAVIAFIISRHLYRYAGNIKTGVEMQSADQVSAAFKNLHSFFKWKGIILIVILSLYVLMIIVMIVAGIAGMSMYGGHQI
jgi:hypothetical protein